MNCFYKSIFFLFAIFLLFSPIKIFALIDINTATLTELDKIIEIGPVTAQKIIDIRPFTVIDDLLKVKGIGEKTLQKIKEQGLVCVNCAEPSLQEGLQTDEATLPTAKNTTSEIATPSPAGSARNDVVATPITYPDGIIINEILPSPAGADEENEWIELYNKNNFAVNLSGWKLKDFEGTTTTYTVPIGVKILANGFLVFKRPDTKISLNNAKDSVTLLFPNNITTSFISFIKAPINQSYSKINDTWVWNTNLTPEKLNVVLPDLPNLNNSDNNNNVSTITQGNLASLSDSAGLAFDSGQNSYTNLKPWFLFIIVSVITIILSTVILIFKIKTSKSANKE